MSPLKAKNFDRIIIQQPVFGWGETIHIGIDSHGLYTVFDNEEKYVFGPLPFGQTPSGHPFVKPEHFRHSCVKTEDEKEGRWFVDLMAFAGHFRKEKILSSLSDVDIYAASLAALPLRLDDNAENTIHALGIWGREVSLLEDVRGFGVILQKGTVGIVGLGDYGYTMSGMFAYDKELPVTGLKAHGKEKTIGIPYAKLRLIKNRR
jgi:hypothetical protein